MTIYHLCTVLIHYSFNVHICLSIKQCIQFSIKCHVYYFLHVPLYLFLNCQQSQLLSLFSVKYNSVNHFYFLTLFAKICGGRTGLARASAQYWHTTLGHIINKSRIGNNNTSYLPIEMDPVGED